MASLFGFAQPADLDPTATPVSSVIVAEDVFVRGGPGEEYLPVGALAEGDPVRGIARNSDATWVMIPYNRGFGWVRRDLAFWMEFIALLPVVTEDNLTPSPVPREPSPTLFLPTATPPGNFVNTTANSAFLRAGPGRGYIRLGQLLPGDLVDPVARNEEATWVMIRYTPPFLEAIIGTATPLPIEFAWIAESLVEWVDEAALQALPVVDEDNLTPTATFTPSRTPSATATPSITPSPSPTATPSFTPTITATLTATATVTSSATASPTATATDTDTAVPTDTATHTATATVTESPTVTATETPEPTWTPVPTETATPTATQTATASDTPTVTPTDTVEPTATAVSTREQAIAQVTETPVPTDTPTPTDTSLPTDTPSPTLTSTPSPTSTATPEPTSTPSPTLTDTLEPSNTPLPTSTATVTASEMSSNTPEPTEGAAVAAINTSTPDETEPPATSPTPEEEAPLAVGPSDAELDAANTDPDADGGPSLETIIGAVILGIVLLYSVAYMVGLRAAGRYSNGFVVNTCPVCLKGNLYIDTRQVRLFGVPVVRRRIGCDNCRSVMREMGTRRWRYAVDRAANPAIYDRYNGKIIEDYRLVELVKNPILPDGSHTRTPPAAIIDDGEGHGRS